MTLVATPLGVRIPLLPVIYYAVTASTALAATADKYAYIGHVYWEGRAASKTISAAGGGSISFFPGATTFANGSTTLDVGIQGVLTSAGPPVRPDGTFSVKRTLTGGVDTITASAWNSFVMTGGSGSKTIAHGDLIAITLDMTARAGADSLVLNNNATSSALGINISNRPAIARFSSAAWQTTGGVGQFPIVALIADDGTYGILDNAVPVIGTNADSFSDATNPDERGLIFQVPWDCKADAFWLSAGPQGATSDFDVKLYSDPLGTPTLITSVSVLAEQLAVAFGYSPTTLTLPSEVSLSRNTDYCLAVKATAAGSVGLTYLTLPNTNFRKFNPGGTTVSKATRDGSSGAFTAESPAVTYYTMGVRVSQLNDGSAGGGKWIGG